MSAPDSRFVIVADTRLAMRFGNADSGALVPLPHPSQGRPTPAEACEVAGAVPADAGVHIQRNTDSGPRNRLRTAQPLISFTSTRFGCRN